MYLNLILQPRSLATAKHSSPYIVGKKHIKSATSSFKAKKSIAPGASCFEIAIAPGAQCPEIDNDGRCQRGGAL